MPLPKKFLAIVLTIGISGCMTSAHLLSAMTTSPDEKTCGFSVVVSKPTFDETDTELKISGGYLSVGDSFAIGVHKQSSSGWMKTSGRTYFTQKAPCSEPTPIVISYIGDGKVLEGTMPLDVLKGREIYGNFYLTVDKGTVKLTLFENIGKTVYAPAPMKMVWAHEPEKLIAELNLQSRTEVPPDLVPRAF